MSRFIVTRTETFIGAVEAENEEDAKILIKYQTMPKMWQRTNIKEIFEDGSIIRDINYEDGLDQSKKG